LGKHAAPGNTLKSGESGVRKQETHIGAEVSTAECLKQIAISCFGHLHLRIEPHYANCTRSHRPKQVSGSCVYQYHGAKKTSPEIVPKQIDSSRSGVEHLEFQWNRELRVWATEARWG